MQNMEDSENQLIQYNLMYNKNDNTVIKNKDIFSSEFSHSLKKCT